MGDTCRWHSGGVTVAYMISGWDAVIGAAVTVALLALSFTGPELVRIHRTLRTLREEPHADEGR